MRYFTVSFQLILAILCHQHATAQKLHHFYLDVGRMEYAIDNTNYLEQVVYDNGESNDIFKKLGELKGYNINLGYEWQFYPSLSAGLNLQGVSVNSVGENHVGIFGHNGRYWDFYFPYERKLRTGITSMLLSYNFNEYKMFDIKLGFGPSYFMGKFSYTSFVLLFASDDNSTSLSEHTSTIKNKNQLGYTAILSTIWRLNDAVYVQLRYQYQASIDQSFKSLDIGIGTTIGRKNTEQVRQD